MGGRLTVPSEAHSKGARMVSCKGAHFAQDISLIGEPTLLCIGDWVKPRLFWLDT
jgi:hypothetical protein